jgi:hypothetical protein
MDDVWVSFVETNLLIATHVSVVRNVNLSATLSYVLVLSSISVRIIVQSTEMYASMSRHLMDSMCWCHRTEGGDVALSATEMFVHRLQHSGCGTSFPMSRYE